MIGPFLKCFAGVVVILIFSSVAILRAVDFNDYNSEFKVQPKSAKFKTAVTLKIAGPPAEPPYRMSKTASPRKASGLRGVFIISPAYIISLAETS